MFAIEKAFEMIWIPIWIECDFYAVVYDLQKISFKVLWWCRAGWSNCLSFLSNILHKVIHIYCEGNSLASILSKWGVHALADVVAWITLFLWCCTL